MRQGEARRLRAKLFALNPFCTYCGDEMQRARNGNSIASLDHIIPLSKGGADDESNIVLCCWNCNRLKSERTPAQLRQLADTIEYLTAALASKESAA